MELFEAALSIGTRRTEPEPGTDKGGATDLVGELGDGAHAIARSGMDGPGEPLPHASAIQRSFGRHVVTQVRAHIGGAAADAAQVLGARAYTAGDDIAFRATPDVHTAAHEAAHVIQQRAGVAPPGLDAGPGGAFERHADQVAAAVTRGESAESLLDQIVARAATAGGPSRPGTAVQRDKDGDATLLATHDEKVRDALLFESGGAPEAQTGRQRAEKLAAALAACPTAYARVLLSRLRRPAPDDELAQLFLRLAKAERTALLALVADRAGSQARPSSLDFGQASREVRELGRVQAERGVYLREAPAPAAARTSDTIIPFNGLVFVDRTTTQPAAAERWAYVVATEHGRSGFVEERYIALDPPDPAARLRRIRGNETLGQIASETYGASFSGGDNQRLYVQGLYEANKHRAGVKLDDVELSVDQTLPRRQAEEETLKIYLGVKVREGLSIWIPSEAFIQQLKAAGAITGGSTEFSKAFRTAKRFFGAALDFVVYRAGFTIGLLEGAFDAIVDLFKGAAEMVQAVMEVVWHLITGNPGRIVDMLSGWVGRMKHLWENKEKIADEFLRRWNADDPWERGQFQGEVLGWLMMTILLALLTLGEGAPALIAGLATKFPRLVQLLKVVDAVGDVTTYARGAARGLTLPGKAVDAVKRRVGKAAAAGDDAADKASEAARRAAGGAPDASAPTRDHGPPGPDVHPGADARGPHQSQGDKTTSPALASKKAGIASHLERFRRGAAFLVPESMYKKFIAGKPFVGREDGLYATTKEAIDRLIAESGGDLAKIKKRLGIPPEYWNEPLWRIDIHDPLLHNARMPSGMEAGANPLFQWGGYTRGGMPEVVLDPVPNGAFGASPTGVKP